MAARSLIPWIFVASTAAGPAFERTGIRGSELLDTVAMFLGSGAISVTGAIETDELTLNDGRTLSNGDIRAVQTAKAAIAARDRIITIAINPSRQKNSSQGRYR